MEATHRAEVEIEGAAAVSAKINATNPNVETDCEIGSTQLYHKEITASVIGVRIPGNNAADTEPEVMTLIAAIDAPNSREMVVIGEPCQLLTRYSAKDLMTADAVIDGLSVVENPALSSELRCIYIRTQQGDYLTWNSAVVEAERLQILNEMNRMAA